MDKSTKDEVTKVVIWGGVAVAAYFVVLKPILDGLTPGGPLKDAISTLGFDSASNNIIAAQNALSPSANPFSYQFQPFIDFYNNNPVTAIAPDTNQGFWSSIFSTPSPDAGTQMQLSIQQFFVMMADSQGGAGTNGGSPWGTIDTVALYPICETVNQMVGAASTVVNALNQVTSQLAMAFVANYTWYNYNRDLLPYLQGGGGILYGVVPSDLAALITKVNSLPLYSS